MTAYFDRRVSQLRRWGEALREGDASAFLERPAAARGDEPYHHPREPVRALEEDMVFDVQLCASLPGFPPDLRDAVQVAVATYGSDPLGTGWLCPDDADEAAHLRRLHYLCEALHDVFHEVGRRARDAPEGSPESLFCDKPDSILAWRASREEDRRVALLRGRPEWADRLRRYDEWVARSREGSA